MSKAAVKGAEETPPPPLHLDSFLPYRLSVAANAVSKRIAAAYADAFDLKIPEWRLIAVLNARGDLTQQALVSATLMDKVAVSRAALLLEKKRYVVRREHKDDARARILSLTPKGQTLYARIAPVARGHEQAILKSFTPSEIATLHALLARVEAAATD